MNSIQLASVICLGACVSPDATLAFPLEEQDKVQVIAAPDYPVPSSPLEEVCYTPQKTDFSVWAPSADQVELRLYKTALSTVPDRTLPMSRAHDGLWNASLQGDLKGKFYTFRVQVSGQWQAETAGIFAKAVGVNGDRGAIIDWQETNPTGWEGDRRPSMTNPADIVVYEMHHRDFSIHPTSGIKHKGKFLALTERGTVTAGGEKTGIDHLKELGITHVHILPLTRQRSTRTNITGDMIPKTIMCRRVLIPLILTIQKYGSRSLRRWYKPCIKRASGWSLTWFTIIPSLLRRALSNGPCRAIFTGCGPMEAFATARLAEMRPPAIIR